MKGVQDKPVDEEGVIQNMKLVVKKTKLEPLGHLVRSPLPGQPLIVQRFLWDIHFQFADLIKSAFSLHRTWLVPM